MKQRTEEDYYVESKRIRKEVLEMAEALILLCLEGNEGRKLLK
jgi:hypothetical protein